MMLPNLKDAKKRTKNKIEIIKDDYVIPNDVKNVGINKKYHIITLAVI